VDANDIRNRCAVASGEVAATFAYAWQRIAKLQQPSRMALQ
jgi:hypothetical protein